LPVGTRAKAQPIGSPSTNMDRDEFVVTILAFPDGTSRVGQFDGPVCEVGSQYRVPAGAFLQGWRSSPGATDGSPPGYFNGAPCPLCWPNPLVLCDGFGCCPIEPGRPSGCTCPTGSIGAGCSQTCAGTDGLQQCAAHGTCLTLSNAQGTFPSLYCHCKPPYFGPSCSTTCPDFQGRQCNGQGRCVKLPDASQPTCLCNSPWTGQACETSLSAGCGTDGLCSGRGICQVS
jgi:hypothetical protein